MNRKYTVLALSAVAMGAVVLTTPQASALPKEPAAASVSQAAQGHRPTGRTKAPATREPRPLFRSTTTRITTRPTKCLP